MVKIADRILFYLYLKPLSYLPLGLLYVYGSFLCFFLYRIVRYRRKVVRANLKNAFPEKSEQELRKIEAKFYQNFMVFIAESVKSQSISEKAVMKRCSIKNPELIQELYDQGKSVIVTCGHYNNWEFYALTLHKLIPFDTYSVYQPMSNPFFEKKILHARTRTGMKLVKAKEVISFYKATEEQQKLMVMVADQSPTNVKKAHWNTFLNQETGWNFGAEKLARKYNHVVLFGHSEIIKKGHYEVEFKMVSDNHEDKEVGAITDIYAHLLEELIIKNPANWLWSHKRWKRSRPVG